MIGVPLHIALFRIDVCTVGAMLALPIVRRLQATRRASD